MGSSARLGASRSRGKCEEAKRGDYGEQFRVYCTHAQLEAFISFFYIKKRYDTATTYSLAHEKEAGVDHGQPGGQPRAVNDVAAYVSAMQERMCMFTVKTCQAHREVLGFR